MNKYTATVVLLLWAVCLASGTRSEGSITEALDTVVAQPADTLPDIGEAGTDDTAEQQPLEDEAGVSETPVAPDTGTAARSEKVAQLRADAEAFREQAARVAFHRSEFAGQIAQNEKLMKAAADKVAALLTRDAVSKSAAAAEDSLLAAAREKISWYRGIIGDLRPIVDSLQREEHELLAQADALERTAATLRGAAARPPRPQPAAFDARESGGRPRFALGYQNHYFFVKDSDGARYAIRGAGLMVSYTLRSGLSLGLRDIMLNFNESIHGERFALTLSPFVAAAFYPLRMLQLEAALGAMTQVQTGLATSGEGDVAVAPYLSAMASLWAVRHFSIGVMLRLAGVATGALQAGAVPADRSDVLPYRTIWLDGGLSFRIHF